MRLAYHAGMVVRAHHFVHSAARGLLRSIGAQLTSVAIALSCVALSSVPDHAYAAAESWRAVGDMSTPREFHTGTALLDGRALIVGGTDPSGNEISNAELFDQFSSQFTVPPNGNLGVARSRHTATRLRDGFVLVVGGQNASAAIAEVEIYDPQNNEWSFVESLSVPRTEHTATLLADGRVLVAGGRDDATVHKTAEIYDPETRAWTPATDMGDVRFRHTAARLLNGHVLVAGGATTTDLFDPDYVSASVEIYDPQANTWTSADPLVPARLGHTTNRLRDGRVLIAGGLDASFAPIAVSEVFDPATGSWRATASQPDIARHSHRAVSLFDDRLLIVGGATSGDNRLRSSEAYDAESDRWLTLPPMDAERDNHTLTVLADGRVLVTGGRLGGGGNSATGQIFEPARHRFRQGTPLTSSRAGHSATLLSDGRVMVTDGRDDADSIVRSTELYDPLSGRFTLVDDGLSDTVGHTSEHAATLLRNGQVLAAGGRNFLGDVVKWTKLFDPMLVDPSVPNPDVWRAGAPMLVERESHTATTLADGRVLVVGGRNNAGEFVAGTEVYDWEENRWSPTGSLSMARVGHTPAGRSGSRCRRQRQRAGTVRERRDLRPDHQHLV